MTHNETLDALYEYADKRERGIPGDAKGVRTYQAWCDEHETRYTVACTKESDNPYKMLEDARFEYIYMPLFEKGLIKASDFFKTLSKRTPNEMP